MVSKGLNSRLLEATLIKSAKNGDARDTSLSVPQQRSPIRLPFTKRTALGELSSPSKKRQE